MSHFLMTEVISALPASYFFMEGCVKTSVCLPLTPYRIVCVSLKRASSGMMVLFSIDVRLSSRILNFGYKSLASSRCKGILHVVY